MLAALFDWYSAVWNKCTLVDVFHYYGFDDTKVFNFESAWKNQYFDSKVGFESFVLPNPCGISIRIDSMSLADAFSSRTYSSYAEIDPSSILTLTFRKIKVDISGRGLEFLRSIDCDIDSIIRKSQLDGRDITNCMHITRLDVAFDWVDENANCLFDLKSWLDDPLRQIDMTCSDRVLCGDRQSMRYSVHWGSERTIYIGATSSDRLLRMYDKKFQFQMKNKWCIDQVPYRSVRDPDCLPDSWIRFEMQLRNHNAQDILFSDMDFFDMLRYLYDHFKFRKERQGEVIDAWVKLFDWDSVQDRIILKSHFVQSKLTPYDSQDIWILLYIKRFALLCAYKNCGFLDEKVASCLNNLRASNRDHDRRRYTAIINFVRHSKGVWEEPPRLRFDKSGFIYFSDFERK